MVNMIPAGVTQLEITSMMNFYKVDQLPSHVFSFGATWWVNSVTAELEVAACDQCCYQY